MTTNSDDLRAAQLAREITTAASKNYGTAGPAFIERLIPDREQLPDQIREYCDSFVSEVCPPGASGQVERVARRVALVGFAGEQATRYGLTGWPLGEATWAAKRIFEDYLSARGGVGRHEDQALLRQVEEFFSRHGEYRFSPWDRAGDDHAPRTGNRAGFVKKTDDGLEYYVFPEVFRNEVIAGFDLSAATKVLREVGWLKTDSQGKSTRKERLPGDSKTRRCYVIRGVGEVVDDDLSPTDPPSETGGWVKREADNSLKTGKLSGSVPLSPQTHHEKGKNRDPARGGGGCQENPCAADVGVDEHLMVAAQQAATALGLTADEAAGCCSLDELRHEFRDDLEDIEAGNISQEALAQAIADYLQGKRP